MSAEQPPGRLGDRVAWVRGNADRELVAFARGQPIPPPDRVTPWAATPLRPEHVEHLAGLRHPVVLADVPDEVHAIVCGHTHMPFVRLTGSRTVVNPGSVGMPYGTRHSRRPDPGPSTSSAPGPVMPTRWPSSART